MNSMKRTVATLTIALAFAAPAFGATEVERTVDAHPRGTVNVSNIAGSVEVFGWSRNEVQVNAELGDDVEELIVERDGDDVIVKVKSPNRKGRIDVTSDLVIRIPERSSLEVGVVSADIDVSDVRGEQNLHAVSGDVTTQAFEGDISIETVSGDIEVLGDGEDNHSVLTSVSGDVEVSGLHGDIELSNVSGDVTVVEGQFKRASANSVNGSIVFRAMLEDRGRLDMETINGSIEVEFEGDVNARFDIESFNGPIDSCFGPKAERTSKYTPGRSLKFTEGDGSARVTARTLNGRFRMCKD